MRTAYFPVFTCRSLSFYLFIFSLEFACFFGSYFSPSVFTRKHLFAVSRTEGACMLRKIDFLSKKFAVWLDCAQERWSSGRARGAEKRWEQCKRI